MYGRKKINGYDVLIIAATRLMLVDYKKGDLSLGRLRRYLTDDSLFVERFGSEMGQYILDHLDDIDLGNYHWGNDLFDGGMIDG
jgi:hypothetical protein